MILKSIKLENIRSYINETIEFPEGSVLLAGDIGSGKSSILQAIEFALFGIKREMPGTSLLRNGKSKGSVELAFDLNGKHILIKRNLKRAKQGVGQESGYMIMDGVKKEGTATELKTAVFELLGYPKSLVSKSKDLIYRYTVYTPQEEMKAILADDKESRLDTLRRVFNIDKYKRINENSVIIIQELRGNIKKVEGIAEGLDDLKKGLDEKLKEKKSVEARLNEILPTFKIKKEALQKKKEAIKKIEKDLETLNELKNELRVSNNELKNKVEQREKNLREIEKLGKELDELKRDEALKTKTDSAEIKNKINEASSKIDSVEMKIKEVDFKINEVQVKNDYSEEIKEKISSLSTCPTCRQQVNEAHKHEIVLKENKKISDLKKLLVIHEEELKEKQEKLRNLKKELEALRETEKSFALVELKLKNFNEKNNLRELFIKEQEKLKKSIGAVNSRKIELNEKLKEFENLEAEYRKIKEDYDSLLEEERDFELKKVSFEKEIEGIETLILNLNEEVNKKLKAKEKIKELKELESWINDFFLNLISLMERQVMLKLHSEFSELFQNWFSILIEDESINARLDENFSPLIEQNNYETGIENLSGGERTSLALAYRLSLNKVINDFIETIKTKDLIILDEPTDGFSTEQLDKVRDVLEQLNIKQVIIVSHETKIESFVENIIRIQKEEHISRAV